ncbi:reverse transcriptase domain-containing protein [Spirochaeta lutea]|uniref:reverse transcriptase domain-containing protein n=1 Tax=Spirochaeta lutea TaxID=1480694 RepID=UPI0009DDC62B|nr:reverse transcriptase domain-containing protein [Spirochaeta lutea]
MTRPGQPGSDIWIWRPINFFQFYRRKGCFIRITDPELLSPFKPEHWSIDRKFNPFYVHKHAPSIARSIAKKIQIGEYKPNPPEIAQIPKKTGGTRNVAMYQIPDAAVSTMFYRRLLRKNKHRFSSFAYAYRNDRNVHFAIQDVSIELKQNSRLFVAEYDFSKFFDSIAHKYLFDQFKNNGFLISSEEEIVIQAFLSERKMGIPQGTSISLFLANLVCWRLDKQLEKEGLQFARYADDTVIWSPDYNKINRAAEIIHEFSGDAGVKINENKSEGISLLCMDSSPAEFARRKSFVDFLGYEISVENVSIKKSSVRKIQKQISYILYKHLLQPLNKSPLRAMKIPGNDKDEALLSSLSEIRRYLYGNLTEEMIASYLSGRSNRIFFKGIMSFYPLIDNEKQIRDLDGWLVNAVFKAVKQRAKLLERHNLSRSHIYPFKASRKDLLAYCNRTIVKKKHLLKIPSFMTIYKAIKKGLIESGIEGIIDPLKDNYNY